MVDIAALITLVVTVSGAVAAGVWTFARVLSGGLQRIHERLDIVIDRNDEDHKAIRGEHTRDVREIHDTLHDHDRRIVKLETTK